MRVAIHQPNFLPWIGYFYKVAQVDKFVLFDDVQLPRGKSFCSRTKILINGRESWLGISVLGKSDKVLIKDAKVNNTLNWKAKHLSTLELNYKGCRYFNEVFPIIEQLYKTASDYLVDYNIPLILELSKHLGVKTDFIRSSEILPENEKKGLERLIEINEFLGADTYVSGSGMGSQRYIESKEFRRSEIELEWQNFEPFEYPQRKTATFIAYLSIVDLLFNCGKESMNFFSAKSKE